MASEVRVNQIQNRSGLGTVTFNNDGSVVFAGAIGVGTVTTSQRNAGVSTATGALIYNTTTNAFEGYSPLGWMTVASTFNATGGTKIPSTVTGNGFTYHVYLGPTSGTFYVDSSLNPGTKTIDMLLVAGGGSGGNTGPNAVNGGGGGAGGIAQVISYPIGSGTYPISVGLGGVSPYPMQPDNPLRSGTDTTFTDPTASRTFTAKGGGAGGSGGPGYASNPPGGNQGRAGGSSGGGAGWGSPPAVAAEAATQPTQNPAMPWVTNYGSTGGPSGNPNTTAPLGVGGGGGGAGTPAPPNADRGGQLNGPPQFNGPGGPGQPFPAYAAPIISPAIPAPVQPTWIPAVGPTGLYGGGGGAGQYPTISATVGSGGPGGGAAGGPGGTPGPNAVNYTGGGGGGTGNLADATARNGGNGGHGILIIRYQD